MKIKHISAILLGIFSYFLIHFVLLGYGNQVAHPAINEVIVKSFENNFIKSSSKIDKFKNYWIDISEGLEKYLGMAVTNLGFFEGTTGETELSIKALEWIKHGGMAADEPEVPASVRHFYDPIGNNGGKKYLTNRGTYWEGIYSNPRTDAIEWALGDTPKGQENIYTWREGIYYMRIALMEEDSVERNKYFAAALRCLGETLHNTGDMGCPGHVRNDSHASPIGYTFGAVLGSPDPYEELFKKSWASDYGYAKPDPTLESYCKSATTARAINEKLAEFTNANFFTHESISGLGKFGNEITPINKNEPAYPSPKLETLEYSESDYTYYKTFPSGRRIKMCKDFTYFRLDGRGYPYIDYDVCKSQAEELMPNIAAAGANIIRLFIPQFKLELKNTDALSDTLELTIKHTVDAEHKDEIFYNGPVKFIVNSKFVDSVYQAKDGKLIITNLKANNGDKIQAQISFIEVTVYSEIITYTKDPLWGTWYLLETLTDSNDPQAPAKGTEFRATKFYKIKNDGKIEIYNSQGTLESRMNYTRTGLSFSITASSATQGYSQTGTISATQDSWSSTVNSTYKRNEGGVDKDYFRKYNSNGNRKPI